MSRAPWTVEDVVRSEDQTEIMKQVIFDALEDTEYFDWIESDDCDTFSPGTSALIERALKEAHQERKREALVALRTLLRLLDAARNEIMRNLGEE